jgi:ABC-type nitrate/sulfonate/bicarbonate transport system permease component
MIGYVASKWRPWLAVLVLLVLWLAITETGLVKPFRLPRPGEVVRAAFDVRNEIAKHTIATVLRLLVGYGTGVALGISGGFLLRSSTFFNETLYPLVESWRPVPTVALVPFFILWFGFSEAGKILLTLLGVALVVVVSTYEAIGNIKPIFVKAAYSLGATKRQMLRTVMLPGILPELRSGLRIALATGFGLVVVSELMGADYGLGQLIDIARRTFSTQTIALAIFLIGGIAVALDKLIEISMDRLTYWSVGSKQAIHLKTN